MVWCAGLWWCAKGGFLVGECLFNHLGLSPFRATTRMQLGVPAPVPAGRVEDIRAACICIGVEVWFAYSSTDDVGFMTPYDNDRGSWGAEFGIDALTRATIPKDTTARSNPRRKVSMGQAVGFRFRRP